MEAQALEGGYWAAEACHCAEVGYEFEVAGIDFVEMEDLEDPVDLH